LRQLAYQWGCAYNAKLVTNGWRLIPESLTELVNEMKIDRIEVTLDGTAEYHDRRRSTKSGGPTFARIFRNVVSLGLRDDLKVALTIRCNVDQGNRDGVLPLLHALVEAGIHRRIERFYAVPVFNWGNDAGQRNVSTAEFARWEISWLAEMTRLGFRAGLLPRREKAGCLALKLDAEVVDPYGALFNCSELPLLPQGERPTPVAGFPIAQSHCGCAGARATSHGAMGDLASGADPALTEFRDFHDRIRRGDYPCRQCAFLPVCGGGCAKQWTDGQSPCPTFKYNMPSRLLLAYAASLPTGDTADRCQALAGAM